MSFSHGEDPRDRVFSIEDPEGFALQHRSEILGELIGLVQNWMDAGKPTADIKTRFNKRRWGNIVGGVLGVANRPGLLANANEIIRNLDGTRREFAALVDELVEHPQGTWTASELAVVCCKQSILMSELAGRSPRSQSTTLGTLASRFVNVTFDVGGNRKATLIKIPTRNGSSYRVELIESSAD